MGTASRQVNSLQITKSVTWTQMQHLAKIVSQIECGTPVNELLIFPISRGNHAFMAYQWPKIGQPKGSNLIQYFLAVSRAFNRPIHIVMLMCYRHEHIKRTMAWGSQRWVDSARIVKVK